MGSKTHRTLLVFTNVKLSSNFGLEFKNVDLLHLRICELRGLMKLTFDH